MKHTLLIAVALMMLTPAVFAQTYKLDEKKLIQQIETSDKDIQNEKRAQKGQTWLDRGDAMRAAVMAVSEKLYSGMPLEMLNSVHGKNYTTSTKDAKGTTFTVLGFPYADVYLLNDVVQFWEEKVNVYDGALEKSFEAYKKAGELDPKLQAKAAEGIKAVADIYKQRAFNYHSLDHNKLAAENFTKAYEVQLDPLVNAADSSAIFNAGYLYLIEKDYDNAIENLLKAHDLNYLSDGNVGYYLMYSYIQTDQNDKAKKIITETAKLFPESKTVIEGLINFYSLTGADYDEIKDDMLAALAKDPNNVVLLTGMAQMYFKQEDMDKSIEMYGRIVKLEPDNFAANFFLAESWVGKANAKILALDEKRQEISEAALKTANQEIDELFKKALPWLEKAYELNPEEEIVLIRLRYIYYRLGEKDPEMDAKYERISKIATEMGIE